MMSAKTNGAEVLDAEVLEVLGILPRGRDHVDRVRSNSVSWHNPAIGRKWKVGGGELTRPGRHDDGI